MTTQDRPQPGQVPEIPERECDEIADHIEGFLNSDRTPADERELRESVAGSAPALAQMSVEELLGMIVRRSCCETAPETLRVRIRTQVTMWRSQR